VAWDHKFLAWCNKPRAAGLSNRAVLAETNSHSSDSESAAPASSPRAGWNGPARIVRAGLTARGAAESFAMIAHDSPSLFEALPGS
jgi:hypothetical protein